VGVSRSSDSVAMAPTIVVGDVHGCLDELRRLLVKCGFRRGDALVLAGDLVAKGPDSRGVIQLAREEGALAVLGNHDDHVLRARAVARGEVDPPRKGIRLEHQKVADSLGPADWAYLEAMPLYLRLGAERPGDADTVVLHAGAVPDVDLEKQTREHLTTMRSIGDDGQPTKRIEGRPWAAVWRGPERIVFGHDAIRGLQQHRLAVGLDTGCVYGNCLTALLLPERRLVSIEARRPYASLSK
jgi:diadenosine tetraphosphatase ApaH/serine/threonine PP2A family protein phosphatase